MKFKILFQGLLMLTFAVIGPISAAHSQPGTQVKECASDIRNPKQLPARDVLKCHKTLTDYAILNELLSPFGLSKPQIIDVKNGDIWGTQQFCDKNSNLVFACPHLQCATVVVAVGYHYFGTLSVTESRSSTKLGTKHAGSGFSITVRNDSMHIPSDCPIQGTTEAQVTSVVSSIRQSGQYLCAPHVGAGLCGYSADLKMSTQFLPSIHPTELAVLRKTVLSFLKN